MGATSNSKSRHYEHPFVRETCASMAWRVVSGLFQAVAVGAGIVSMVFFVLGMLEIQDAITALKPPVLTPSS